MALDDIIKSIANDTQAKVAEIKKQGAEILTTAKKTWAAKVEDRKAQVISNWRNSVQKKISQSVLKLKADGQNKLLLEKQRVIDSVFSQGLGKLGQLPDTDYVEILVKLLDKLPGTEGDLYSVKGKKKQLQSAVTKAKSKQKVVGEEVDGLGGFVFKTENYSIDNRFAKLLENKKDDLRVTIGKILFG